MRKRNDKKIISKCLNCGKEIQAYRKSKKYCKECNDNYLKEKARLNYIEKKKNKIKIPRIIKCEICGNEVIAEGKTRLKYCSDNCRNEVKKNYKQRRIEYYKKNPEKKKESNKKYYQKNREKCLTYSKKQYLLNKEKYDSYKRKHQNNKFYGGNKIEVLIRDNYTCQNCNSKINLLVHHKDGINIFNGDPNNNLDNLITLCRSCHNKIHFIKNKR